MGSLADIWRDAGGSVVGVSDDAFKNFGFDQSQVASIGDHTSISIEQILALNPDFVILSGNSDDDNSNKGPSQDQLRRSLEASGIPVAFFKVDTFDDYLRMLKTCTQVTGRDDLYKQNGTDVQDRVNQALSQYSVADKQPTVLVMNASSKGVSAQKPDHMASEMVKALGAKLLTEENPSLLTDFSMEAVAELDPDYIFVLPAAKDDATAKRNYEQAVEGNAAWQGPGLRDPGPGPCHAVAEGPDGCDSAGCRWRPSSRAPSSASPSWRGSGSWWAPAASARRSCGASSRAGRSPRWPATSS